MPKRIWTLLIIALVTGLVTACAFCPVPDGCGPVSHDPHIYDAHHYNIDLVDATNGRIVSGYSDIDVTIHMNHGPDEKELDVSPRGQFGLITPGKELATGITVKAFGYEPYYAPIGENERKIVVKLQPVTTGEYVRYTGVVTDKTTGKGVQVADASLLYDQMRYRLIYVYDDGTFDFLANVRYLPKRIAIQARGYAGYDADLAPGERNVIITLRPVAGETVSLGGIISEAGTRKNIPVSAGLTGRIYFSDGSDELLAIEPYGAYHNGFTVNTNRIARQIVVTAAGYETFRADLPPALGQFDIALRRLDPQP